MESIPETIAVYGLPLMSAPSEDITMLYSPSTWYANSTCIDVSEEEIVLLI